MISRSTPCSRGFSAITPRSTLTSMTLLYIATWPARWVPSARLDAVPTTVITLSDRAVGGVYQQKFCAGVDFRAAAAVQNGVALLPAAARGQRITFTYTPDGGTHVSVENGGEGHFAGIDFNRAFLSLWLGPNADPDVRQGLIAATTR